MENLSHLAGKIPDQISTFLGKLSLPKKSKQFVYEATYGILARQSVRLTEIARGLNEGIKLKHTIKRMSRQMQQEGLEQSLTSHVVKANASRIRDKTLLVIDPSDIGKKYAKSMEYQAHVRDGSEGKIVEGYWFCSVIGVECDGLDIIPLCNRLWSQKSPAYNSENDEIRTCIDRVIKHTQNRGIWVMDRGADRSRLYENFLSKGQQFIVRLIGNRHLEYRGQSLRAEDVANRCSLPYAERIIKQCKDGRDKIYDISFGVRRVKLPNHPQTSLSLVVVKGFGKKPLMLLTTERIRKSYKSVRWLVRAYLTRWRIEDTIRFAKQSYQLEDVRLLKYASLQNLMGIVLVAMSFTMTHLGSENKLKILASHALKASNRLFGIPDFRYYALADGIQSLLQSRRKPLAPMSCLSAKTKHEPQLHFDFGDAFG